MVFLICGITAYCRSSRTLLYNHHWDSATYSVVFKLQLRHERYHFTYLWQHISFSIFRPSFHFCCIICRVLRNYVSWVQVQEIHSIYSRLSVILVKAYTVICSTSWRAGMICFFTKLFLSSSLYYPCQITIAAELKPAWWFPPTTSPSNTEGFRTTLHSISLTTGDYQLLICTQEQYS